MYFAKEKEDKMYYTVTKIKTKEIFFLIKILHVLYEEMGRELYSL